jgi:hypothetical protein
MEDERLRGNGERVVLRLKEHSPSQLDLGDFIS